MIQIPLKLGSNALPHTAGVAVVRFDPNAYGYVVQVVREGRDCGTYSGSMIECEVWVDGYLQAWFSKIGLPG